MINKKISLDRTKLIREIDELEENIQLAIDDIIYECDESSILKKQHVNLIVTQLAKAAADLRIRKQQEKVKCF